MKQGWVEKKLGDVCDVVNGGTPKTSISEYWNGNNLWITPKDMGKLDSIYVEDTSRKITDEGMQNSSAKLFSAHSVVLSSRAPIGHLAINKKPISTNQGCKGIVPSDEINYLYLYYFLKNSVKLLNSLGTGTTFKELSSGKLKNVIIPIPPLEEQKQIVAKLDQCFEAIDKAKANAAKNLENAKELFQSKLNDILSQKGEGWVEKRFDEVCVLQRGFDLPTRMRKKGDYPLVSSNGITDYVDTWKVTSPGVSTGRSGTIGKVHFIEKNYFPLNTSLYIKEFHGNDKRCIYYFLKQFDLLRFQSGAGVPTLNRNNVHSVKVYFPNSIQEQKQIVAKLDDISKQTQSLESKYQQELNSLEELKKSILQKAFEGEL